MLRKASPAWSEYARRGHQVTLSAFSLERAFETGTAFPSIHPFPSEAAALNRADEGQTSTFVREFYSSIEEPAVQHAATYTAIDILDGDDHGDLLADTHQCSFSLP